MQKFDEYFTRTLPVVLHNIEACEIQVRLIESWRGLYGSLEFFLSLRKILLPDEENTEVIHCFNVSGTKCDCFLKIARRLLELILLRVQHAKAIVDFSIVGFEPDCLVEALLSCSKVPLPAVYVAEIEESGGIGGPLLERFLKIGDRFLCLARLRGDHAEVIPGLRIIGL